MVYVSWSSTIGPRGEKLEASVLRPDKGMLLTKVYGYNCTGLYDGLAVEGTVITLAVVIRRYTNGNRQPV
jgi:lipid-binding SYLF domain-containing protein